MSGTLAQCFRHHASTPDSRNGCKLTRTRRRMFPGQAGLTSTCTASQRSSAGTRHSSLPVCAADSSQGRGCQKGTAVWLNTTLPLSFPAPYGGREVRLYIGPVQEPFRSRDDILRVFVDVDKRSWSGYAIDGIGADRMIELAGASGLVGGATYLGFAGSYPGEWAWLPLSNVSFAMGPSATEFAVGADLGGNTSRFYVEIGDSVGAFDVLGPASRGTRRATPPLPSGVPRSPSLFNAPPPP